MPELFLAAFGFVLLLLLLQKLEHAETRLLIKTLKWTFVGVLVLAGIFLTLVGRLFHVAAIIVLLALLLRQDIHTWIKHRRSPPSLSPPLTKEEAAKLLNVGLKSSSQDIKKAFEKIKPKDSSHQDRLRQARDLLLKGKKK